MLAAGSFLQILNPYSSMLGHFNLSDIIFFSYIMFITVFIIDLVREIKVIKGMVPLFIKLYSSSARYIIKKVYDYNVTL